MKYGPYSPSRLEVALCPYRFQREYINKNAPKGHSEAANRGQVVHLTLEKITESFIKGAVPTPVQVNNWLDMAMDEFNLKEADNFHFVRQAALNYLQNKKHPFAFDKIVGVEEGLAVRWKDGVYSPCEFNDPKAILRGKIDLLEIQSKTGLVVDHKNQRNIEEASTFQQGCYAFLVKAHYPYLENIYSRLHFCAPELNFYSQPALWGPNELELIRKDFERLGRTAEATDPNSEDGFPGHHCRYCPVMSDCPLKAEIAPNGEVSKPGVVRDGETAVQYAQYYVYMEQYMKQLKKHLQQYVKHIGPVPVSNMIAELRMSESHDIKNQGGLRAVLAKHQIPPESFTEITTKCVKRLVDNFEGNEAVKTDLLRAAPVKSTQRFGVYINK